MVKVLLPEFYIALVLDEASCKQRKCEKLSSKHVEAVQKPTCDFVTSPLQAKYYPKLERVDLPFVNIEIGSNKPSSKFHVYWQIKKGAAHFDVTKDDMSTADPQDFFDKMASEFETTKYCHKVLRGSAASKTSPLTTLVEVQIQRLKPMMTEGGSVQIPPFYVAFVCETPPKRNLNDKEKQKITDHTHKHALEHLTAAFPKDEFKDLNLKVTKTEINENAGKPESKFNLYIQFEGTANFIKNAPEDPMIVFRPLTNCMSRGFLSGTRDCGGSILGDVIKMAIRVVVYSELDMPVKLRRGTLDADVKYIPVKIHIEYFVALVVRDLEKLPASKDLTKLDDYIQDFFTRCLQVWYPENFMDLKLDSKPEYDAGRPLPRYNMLHQYHAVLRFYQPPDPTVVLTKIVNCNVAALLSHINSNSESMWKRTAEVTLGRGLAPLPHDHIYHAKIDAPPEEKKKKNGTIINKNEPEVKKTTTTTTLGVVKKEKNGIKPTKVAPAPPAASSKPSPPKPKVVPAAPPAPPKPPPKPSPKVSRPAAPPVTKKPSPAPTKKKDLSSSLHTNTKPVPKKVSSKPARPKAKSVPVTKAATPPVAPKPPQATGTPNKPVKKKTPPPPTTTKKASPKIPAKPAPATKPKKKAEEDLKQQQKDKNGGDDEDDGKHCVGTSDVYLSLTVSNCDNEPSKSNYEKLAKATEKFYTSHLKSVFGDNFHSVSVAISRKEFGTGKVNKIYNVYVEWDIVTRFHDAKTAPDRYKLCAALIKLDLMKLLVDYIRTIKATPFQDSTAIFTQQVNS